MARGYLAVDGGGSSSEFLLVNEAGEELLHFFVGSTSKKSIGVEGAAVNISLGARKLLDYLESDDCVLTEVRGVWGLSGCDSAADQAEYEAMLVRAGLDLAFHQVVNDSLLALRAVTSGPGIVLIAGTGSICIGVNAAGETVRLGSWGYQVSDLGSGTWVGSQLLREALQGFVDQYDALLEVRGKGLMLGLVCEGEAKELVEAFKGQGLLTLTAGAHVVRFLPPLTLGEDDLEDVVDMISDALGSVYGE